MKKTIKWLSALCILLIATVACKTNDGTIPIYQKPVAFYADLNGNHKNEKIIISQSQEGSSETYNISIQIYEDGKLVFENKQKSNIPIWYVKIVRFSNGPSDKNFYRDVVFMITGVADLYLQILSWESQNTEADVVHKTLGKGRYRLIKTDVQINTPYG